MFFLQKLQKKKEFLKKSILENCRIKSLKKNQGDTEEADQTYFIKQWINKLFKKKVKRMRIKLREQIRCLIYRKVL